MISCCALEVFLCWVWWRREISRPVSHNGLPDEEATKLLLILHIVTTHTTHPHCSHHPHCHHTPTLFTPSTLSPHTPTLFTLSKPHTPTLSPHTSSPAEWHHHHHHHQQHHCHHTRRRQSGSQELCSLQAVTTQ